LVAIDSGCTPKLDKSEKIARRVDRALEHFPYLPDDALIEIRVISALLGRSTASIWRDVAHGRLAQPVRIGRSTRWRVGAARAAMKGEAAKVLGE
jgi:predicted DNA-binding transcriptional regulator AlpA